MSLFVPFTLEDIAGDHCKPGDWEPELYANAVDLCESLNEMGERLYDDVGIQLRIVHNNGYRPVAYNTAIGGAPRSAHLTCKAADLQDGYGHVDEWIQANLDFMKSIGFVGIEHPDNTPGWAHVDFLQRYNQRMQPLQVFRAK